MLSVERLLVMCSLLWINDNMMTTFANNFSHIIKLRMQHFIEAFVHDVEKISMRENNEQ